MLDTGETILNANRHMAKHMRNFGRFYNLEVPNPFSVTFLP